MRGRLEAVRQYGACVCLDEGRGARVAPQDGGHRCDTLQRALDVGALAILARDVERGKLETHAVTAIVVLALAEGDGDRQVLVRANAMCLEHAQAVHPPAEDFAREESRRSRFECCFCPEEPAAVKVRSPKNSGKKKRGGGLLASIFMSPLRRKAKSAGATLDDDDLMRGGSQSGDGPFSPSLHERRYDERLTVADFDLIKVVGKGAFGKVMLNRERCDLPMRAGLSIFLLARELRQPAVLAAESAAAAGRALLAARERLDPVWWAIEPAVRAEKAAALKRKPLESKKPSTPRSRADAGRRRRYQSHASERRGWHAVACRGVQRSSRCGSR